MMVGHGKDLGRSEGITSFFGEMSTKGKLVGGSYLVIGYLYCVC
jgi:hypothetical protein